MLSDSSETFINGFDNYLRSRGVSDFTIWRVTGNICEPTAFAEGSINGTFDIYELGVSDENFTQNRKDISYFDESFHINYTFFLGHKNHTVLLITFHGSLSESVISELKTFAPALSARIHELSFKGRQMDLYVDYQKKVDFVKKASVIFKALEIEDVISISLTFFMDVFSAEGAFALHDGTFSAIGLDEKDIDESIFVAGQSLRSFISQHKQTEFFENIAESSKFNIKNIFLVYEELTGITFLLFNIIVDIVPDKEFSSLVSSIISIAAENAMNHEIMTQFKVEETEMTHTVDILNRFVNRRLGLKSDYDIFAVNYPAKSAGGDFVDLQKLNDSIIFCIADVCGKGYSAAVFTVVLSVFAESAYLQDVLSVVLKLNRFLISKNFSERFITGFFAKLDTVNRQLEYISCGHDPVVLIDKAGNYELLTSKYLPLGLLEEQYYMKSIYVSAGSILFAYTDGLIEYATLEELIVLVLSIQDKSSEEIADYLYTKLVTDHNLQKDDFTTIIMKF